MFEFEDFIEYVYDNPYDYVSQSQQHVSRSQPPPPKKSAADRQREYREKLKRKNLQYYEKLRQQTVEKLLKYSRKNEEEKQDLRRERTEVFAKNQENAKSENEPTEQVQLDGNDELLQTQLKVENRKNIRNLQRRTDHKRKVVEEFRKNFKGIMKKYNALERKSNRQQKRIEKLEETCKYLKTELKTLKLRNNTENTECEGIGESEMLQDSSPSHIKVESGDDPISLTTQCKTSINVRVEEDISEDPLNIDSELNTTNVKKEEDTAEDDCLSPTSQRYTSASSK